MIRRNFVARTFALVRNVLPRVLQGNLTVPNAPKWYKTHQNMSLGCNGGGSGAFVAKNSDATSWHEHFATKAPDPPHWTLNSCFVAFRTIWVHLGPFGCLTKLGVKQAKLVQKFVPRSCVGIFRNERTRWYETHQNMSLGSNGVDRVLLLRNVRAMK